MLRKLMPVLLCLFICAAFLPHSATGLGEKPIEVLVQQNVPVKMRDGVILRAGIQRPDHGGPYPALVLRTPYGKGGPGHCIRLDITSSDFPNFDRNHNTAANQNAENVLESARQTIHHGGTTATHIILPMVANKEKSK